MYAVSQNCSSFCFVRFFIFLPRVVPATEPNELMSTTMVLREKPTNGPGYCHPILNFSHRRNCNNFPTEWGDNLWALVHYFKREKSYEGVQKILQKEVNQVVGLKKCIVQRHYYHFDAFHPRKTVSFIRWRYETGHMTNFPDSAESNSVGYLSVIQQ